MAVSWYESNQEKLCPEETRTTEDTQKGFLALYNIGQVGSNVGMAQKLLYSLSLQSTTR